MATNTEKPGNIISVPSRGQPIDSAFLHQMANAINTLGANFALRKGKTFIKSSSSTPGSPRPTANSSIHASVVQVPLTSEKVDSSTKISVKISFAEVGFDGPPVITATPIVEDATQQGAFYAIATVANVSKQECTVNITFASQAELKSLSVSVIAIGKNDA
jgi:hypothetical protein